MIKGVNRAVYNYKNSFNEQLSKNQHKPCIFLSHKSEDKEKVEQIGNYIMNRGLDIYLDKNDDALQQADKNNDDVGVTKCIQKGINNCTHMMCILSQATVKSWWVPYELGFGERSGKGICSLKLKEISSSQIPSYIRIKKCLEGEGELKKYIDSLAVEYGILSKFSILLEEKSNVFASYNNRELSDVLDS